MSTDGREAVFVYKNTNLPILFGVGIRQSVRDARWHSRLSFLWFDRDDLRDGFFHIALAEQNTPADFVGLDFTAIDSGGEGNEGNLEECGNLFAGQVTLCLLSSGDRLHLLHLFMHGLPDQVGKLFNGQAVQNQVFFHSG